MQAYYWCSLTIIIRSLTLLHSLLIVHNREHRREHFFFRDIDLKVLIGDLFYYIFLLALFTFFIHSSIAQPS